MNKIKKLNPEAKLNHQAKPRAGINPNPQKVIGKSDESVDTGSNEYDYSNYQLPRRISLKDYNAMIADNNEEIYSRKVKIGELKDIIIENNNTIIKLYKTIYETIIDPSHTSNNTNIIIELYKTIIDPSYTSNSFQASAIEKQCPSPKGTYCGPVVSYKEYTKISAQMNNAINLLETDIENHKTIIVNQKKDINKINDLKKRLVEMGTK